MNSIFNRRYSSALIATAAAAVLAGASASQAALQLTVNGVTINDNGAGDGANTTNGTITNVSTVPGFTVVVTVASSNSPGTASGATLSLNSLEVIPTGGAGAASLTISASDTDFTSPGGAGSIMQLTSSLAGTMTGATIGDSDTYTSYADPANGAFTTLNGTVPIVFTKLTPDNTNTFSSEDSNVFVRSGTAFSLSDKLTLSLSAGAQANLTGTTTATAPVPEPTTLGVLGIAAATMVRRRRR